MHRLFVGLRPPRAIRAALLATMGGVNGARWQSDAQLHITLRFIGAVDAPVADGIAAALHHVAAGAVPIALHGVGTFDTRGRPTTLWAGVAPNGALDPLHRKIDRLLVQQGLAPERRAYHPHVTLARLNAAAGPVDRWLASHAGLASAAFPCGGIILYESTLTRDGARYAPIVRYPPD